MSDIIKKRRSVRKFTVDPVETDNIKKLLRAGTLAPSGKNGQPWRFAVVQQDKTLLRKIAACTVYEDFVCRADCLVCVFMDKLDSYHYVKDCQAIGACIQNMLLKATELELGACWIGEILNRDAQVKRLLGIDNRYDLMAVVAVGQKSGEKECAPSRKQLQDLILSYK